MRSKLFYITFTIFLCISFSLNAQQRYSGYVPYKIIIKIDESVQTRGDGGMWLDPDQLKNNRSVKSAEPMFPQKQLQKRGVKRHSVLDGIYTITLTDEKDAAKLMQELKHYKNVIYVEREPLFETLLIPNDPAAQPGAEQSYLTAINVYDAWNIQRGDTSIVIGIIDSGTDLDHEDLAANLYLNHRDPINGLDDDADGYVDNYYGWDFADNNNMPEADGSAHGTLVSGVAVGVPNNGKGIAGVGYNSRYMPIKIFKTVGNTSSNAYQSIVYAADMGCKVINLSWGSAGTYTQFGQDIINYAVLEKDVVVIAAAGNTAGEFNFYPASFENVISVGAVNNDGIKPVWATISKFIDINAPGVGIYSTTNGDLYNADSGTSLAAPMVAGAAALLRAQFPELNALQIGQRLRMTTTDMYDINAENIRDLLGTGTLDVYNALSVSGLSAIRFSDFSYTNGFGQFAFRGDSINISMQFTNYLDPVSDFTVKLESSSPYVTLAKSETNLTNMEMMASVYEADAFSFYISENAPENELLRFKIIYDYGNRKDYQYFDIFTNGRELLINETDLAFTVNSRSGLANAINNWKGQSVIRQAGWLFATGENHFVHNTHLQNTPYTVGSDFDYDKGIRIFQNSIADFDLGNEIQVSGAAEYPLPISFEQSFLHWAAKPNILIHEIFVMNNSSEAIQDMYVSHLVDYHILKETNNRLKWDEEKQMSVASSSASEILVGIALLTDGDVNFYAVDKTTAEGNIADYETYFSNALKLGFLQSESPKLQAGQNGEGNDVLGMFGLKLAELPSENTETIAISYLFSENESGLEALKSTADSLYNAYKTLPRIVEDIQLCPNTAYTLSRAGKDFRIYDAAVDGNLLFEGSTLDFGVLAHDSTLFFQEQNDDGIFTKINRLKLSIKTSQIDFEMDSSLLLVEEGSSARMYFRNLTPDAISWQWDFGNGYQSAQSRPSSPFSEEGIYDIRLIIINSLGCTDSIIKQLEVAYRAEKPQLSDLQICQGERAHVFANNTNHIAAYADEQLQHLLYEGDVFLSDPIHNNTSYYVTNLSGAHESLPTKLNVGVYTGKAVFSYNIDTTDTENRISLLLSNESEYAQSWLWYVNHQEAGNQGLLSVDISGQTQLHVKLSITTADGCVLESEESILFEESPKAAFADLHFCSGQQVVLSPIDEGVYFFYADAQAQQLLHKGRSMFIDSLSYGIEYFVQRVDALLPGELVKIPLQLSAPTLEIQSGSDTVNLAIESGLRTFEAIREGAHEFRWTFEGKEHNAPSIDLFFTTPGNYTVILESWDNNSCYLMTEKNILVADDLLLSNESVSNRQVLIFPNPSRGLIKIEISPSETLSGLVIYNTQGKVVMNFNTITSQATGEFDISRLEQGIYLLEVNFESGRHLSKIVLRK